MSITIPYTCSRPQSHYTDTRLTSHFTNLKNRCPIVSIMNAGIVLWFNALIAHDAIDGARGEKQRLYR